MVRGSTRWPGSRRSLKLGAVNTIESPIALRRGSLRFRCSALAWAVAVAFGLFADVSAERDCPHHEVGGHGEHGAHTVDGTGFAAHAGHGGHYGTSHTSEADDEESGTHSDPCLCLGFCQAGSTIALPAGSAQPLADVAGTPSLGVLQLAEIELPGRAPFVLPYSHAPPVSA
jgi:hypothetical protein